MLAFISVYPTFLRAASRYSLPKPTDPGKLGIKIEYPSLRHEYLNKVKAGSIAPCGPPWARKIKGLFFDLYLYSSKISYSFA